MVEGSTFTDNARAISLGLDVADSPGTRVDGNTVSMPGNYPNAIEYRLPRTTGVTVADNVVDAAILARWRHDHTQQ